MSWSAAEMAAVSVSVLIIYTVRLGNWTRVAKCSYRTRENERNNLWLLYFDRCCARFSRVFFLRFVSRLMARDILEPPRATILLWKFRKCHKTSSADKFTAPRNVSKNHVIRVYTESSFPYQQRCTNTKIASEITGRLYIFYASTTPPTDGQVFYCIVVSITTGTFQKVSSSLGLRLLNELPTTLLDSDSLREART